MITIAQLIIVTTYLIYIGKLKSFSESYYQIQQPNLFRLFCLILGGLQIAHSTEWFFLSGVGLIFVGAAAEFKRWRTEKYVHNIGAVVAILSPIIDYSFMSFWLLLIVVPIGFCSLIKKDKIWWIEVVSIYMILGVKLLIDFNLLSIVI